MKKLNQIAVLLVAVASIGTSFAAEPYAGDNWLNANGDAVWKNGDGTLCWQDSNWTPATAASVECGRPAPAVAAPAPAPAPTPAPEVVVAEQIRYAAEALFDFDKSVLKPEGKAILQDLVNKMRSLALVEVLLAKGYTDSTGPAQYNLGLSNRRADAVKAYLVSLGVPANAITTEGFGENDPVASNKTKAGRAQNRRVEIEVVGRPR